MEKKILVVDDSRFIFEEMKHKLHPSQDYAISYYCPDGNSLTEAYERHKPDLVTVDIVMPGIDGIEAARRLLEKHPDARVLIVTSLVFEDTMADAEKIGALGLLAKPFDREQLLGALDEAFQKRP